MHFIQDKIIGELERFKRGELTCLSWLHRDIMMTPKVQTSPRVVCCGNSGPCQTKVPA